MGDEYDVFVDAKDEFSDSDVEEDVSDQIVKASEFPEFYEGSDPVTFLDWLDEVESIFDVKGTKDPTRVKVVVSGFKPFARAWWDDLQQRRVQEGAPEITTWSEMCREMYYKFVQDSYLLSFQQSDGMSVEEYTKIFKQLCHRADIDNTELERVLRYVDGLQEVIQYAFLEQPTERLKKAIEIACKTEELWKSSLEAGINIWESYALKFRQSTLSVDSYTNIFQLFCDRAEIDETQQQQVIRYVEGLHEVFRYAFINRRVTRMKNAIKLARMSEKQLKFANQAGINIWEWRRMEEEKKKADFYLSNRPLSVR